MVAGPCRGDVVGVDVVRMSHPEILAVVEENLFARSNFTGRIDANPVLASCRAYISPVARSEPRVGPKG